MPEQNRSVAFATADDAVAAEKRGGFTLVELLIVIVVIGILTQIAFPKFAAYKEKAYVARMTNDLRNLAVSEEAYFNDAATYYNGTIPAADLIFAPSTGVTIVIDAATSSGWSGSATSVGTARECDVFHGTAAPVGTATVEGVTSCTP
jgi:prepilin-type N-terminal cleavage/methylation domain-containing protein